MRRSTTLHQQASFSVMRLHLRCHRDRLLETTDWQSVNDLYTSQRLNERKRVTSLSRAGATSGGAFSFRQNNSHDLISFSFFLQFSIFLSVIKKGNIKKKKKRQHKKETRNKIKKLHTGLLNSSRREREKEQSLVCVRVCIINPATCPEAAGAEY